MLLNCKKLNDFFNVSNEEFMEIEELWKSQGNSGCLGEMNPFYGLKHTEETKQLISEKMLELLKEPKFKYSRTNCGEKNGMYGSKRIGKLNPMFGKKQSEETKKKIGEKVRQRYYDGLVNPRKGIKLTEKQKKKISQNNSKTFVIKHPNGNIIQITNLSQYCKENNLNAAMMSRVSRGIAKHHKGYTTI